MKIKVDTKQSIIRFFKFIIPLFILTFVIAYPFLFFSTYIHEVAHVNVAGKNNISMIIRNINYIPDIKNILVWGHGGAVPISEKECQKFNNLPVQQRKEITHAGVTWSISIFTLFFIISLTLLIKYWKFVLKKSPFWFSFWILITLLFFAIIIFGLIGNVFSQDPLNDWNLKYLNCSAIFP